MGSVSARPERAIEELVEGQEYANQLQILFRNPSSSQGTAHLSSALIDKILRSFDQALAVLSSVESAEVSLSHTASNEDSSINSSSRPPATKGKRGCYKRKRSADAWTVVSATMEDGHAWRKYGQKEILSSKHPRSYFRCTRKYDQGCGAIKQVQRMEDGSQMYRTTYIGTHTCTNHAFNAPPLIITNSESWETGTVDNGDSEILIKHHDQRSDPTPKSVAIRQETKEETSTDVTELDCMMWKDLMGDGFEYCSEPGEMVCNVYPACAEMSCPNFELEFGIKPMKFENDFEFDDSDECEL
ncbi:hypothetical protein F3Y22_tig00001293pilonHSYRG00003 [Hibiscus syriacus]|uniref:WRKY domain-containing protein n=1 Tax=Hibiscus syriacus TaxID=106335 RepID=A0A6A3D2A7_HIBSY|nr:WRKY DNA-binding transcription factor 70-like [Hibiscus syriacus]KAE8733409.1 hypothetical protein F3Y22_tig00001293pilonHSYRG00003 [Hibiscus syriacus]